MRSRNIAPPWRYSLKGITMKIERRAPRRARIEMIPLIDCMFLILAFFIYAILSMAIQRGISVDLPLAKSALVEREKYISLTIKRSGEIYLDKRKVFLEDLKVELSQRKKINPQIKVLISGDKRTHYKMLVEVLDVVRESGLRRVLLRTEFAKNG